MFRTQGNYVSLQTLNQQQTINCLVCIADACLHVLMKSESELQSLHVAEYKCMQLDGEYGDCRLAKQRNTLCLIHVICQVHKSRLMKVAFLVDLTKQSL